MHKFGNYWLGYFIFLVFFTVVADLVVLIIKLITRKKRPAFLKKTLSYILVGMLVIIASAGMVVYGTVHARKTVVHSYEVSVDKDGNGMDELNIVLISDLHLGYSIGCDMMEQMVDKINALNPDIIVIAGDIVDNDYDALEDPDRLADILCGLKSKYGTYGVYGNHDVDGTLIGGFSVTPAKEQFRDERVVEFLKDCNITMLEDESVLIDDSFYLVGRKDGERAGDGTKKRASIEELTGDLDKDKLCIMLSHEPDELEENAANGMDLQLSGHTHAGQFFPLTITSPLAWENDWGYLEVDGMHDFVSCGVGVYGPFLRIGTDSEIMQIKVRLN